MVILCIIAPAVPVIFSIVCILIMRCDKNGIGWREKERERERERLRNIDF